MGENKPIINRAWAMPNKYTFTIPPIAELIQRYVGNGQGWIDPFAGNNSPAEYRNDHRSECKSEYHLDAIDFVRLIPGPFVGCLFDPPYSIHEVKRHYDNIGAKYDFKNDPTCAFKSVRDEIATKILDEGLVIYFGWNTNAFGLKRGFHIEEILVVAHGGNRNDTLVTVERKCGHEEKVK